MPLPNIYKQRPTSLYMEENLDPIPKEDLIYDACLLLHHMERPEVERYVSAIIDCDFGSDALPQCQRSYKCIWGGDATDFIPCDDEGLVPDIIMIISDFCELPPMLPHIHSFIDALWVLNRGD